MVARPGFSLVEMIVAMLLLSIAMLAIAASGLMAARMLQQAELREEVAWRASAVLDSLTMSDARGGGEFRSARYDMSWSASRTFAVQVRMHDGSAFDLQALP